MTIELTEDTAMKKNILLLTLAIFFSISISGCSLFSSSDDEQETATVSEEQEVGAEGSDGEFASDDFENGDDTDAEFNAEEMASDDDASNEEDLVAEDVEVEDNFGDEGVDDYPDDDYSGKGKAAETAATDTQESADDYIDDNSFASEDSLAIDEGGGLPESTMTANQEEDLFGQEEQEPVVDTPSFADNSFSDTGISDMEPVADVPQFIPVKKMKPAAYKRAGGNVNRLYVVRPGDNMDTIAEKLYGSSDKSSDLYAYNSHFQGKALNVGDKIYYESPNNKNDQSMLTYYEDNNIAPQYYTSQDGDNIRKIAKKLLGHERSWMEIYATNESVNSKSRLPAGLQLRYWPDGSTPAPIQVAQNQEPEPAPAVEEPAAIEEPEIAEVEEVAEPPVEEPAAVAQIEEPKPLDDPMDDDFNPPPPPTAGSVVPPPPKPISPPPPPPAPKAKFNKPAPPTNIGNNMNNQAESPLAGMGEDSTIMAALGGLFILAFIILLIFIRRSRAKRVNFSQTQV